MAVPPILQNLRIPVIGSPLFIISNPDLVIAQCKAGIVGSFPALNARPEAQLDEWLDRITTELAEHDAKNPDRPSAPFAVNQIVHKTNNRVDHDVEMCVKYKVPVVITSLGAREEVNQADMDNEREIFRAMAIKDGKPEKIVDKIVDGKMEKYYSEHVLLEQPFVKDTDKTVADILKETIGSLGENISIKRFARFRIGE